MSLTSQGRRRFVESGTAIGRRRRSVRTEGPSRAREGDIPPSRKGGSEKNFKFKMTVEAILMHFETVFACEIRLIVQAFHVAVLKRVSKATTKK